MGAQTNALVSANDPGIVLIDKQAYSIWYEALKAEAAAVPINLETKKGQDALRSMAAKIRSEKAGIKKARLRLTEEWRSMTAQANAAGKEIDEQLEALAVETRAPLTAWEEAEEARVSANAAEIDCIRQAGIIQPDDTAEMVGNRGREIWGMSFDAPQWTPEEAAGALVAKDTAIAALRAAQARLKQEEADRAELARLRQEAADREAREAAAQMERDRVEAALREAEAQEQAERDRVAQIERIKREAAESAARDAERVATEKAAQAAAEVAAQIQAAHDAEIAEQRRIALEAQAERDKLERARAGAVAKAARQAEDDRQAAETERKRQANRNHRSSIQREVKEALMTIGVGDHKVSEALARLIVMAIVAGNVPHTEVKF
jgi:hypothetical protein